MIAILFPMSWISSVASVFHDPPISIAAGIKMRVLVMPGYFVFLAMGALSAAAACREVLSRWEHAYVSGTVTFQAIGLPQPKVLTLYHLHVWRLRVIDQLAPWKLVPQPSLLLSILCR